MIDDVLSRIGEGLATAQRPCITVSFQVECVVLLHLLQKVRPGIPVLFIDTSHHFAETLAYRDRLAQAWGLNVQNVKAMPPRPGLWRDSTDACCAHHKTGPLFAALAAYDTWFTALRREQSPSRAQLTALASFRLPNGETINKVSPLVDWRIGDVLAYAQIHEIPLLPLYERGYTSIGCEPCTQLPIDPSNPRSGRWGGAKLECGIHIESRGPGVS